MRFVDSNVPIYPASISGCEAVYSEGMNHGQVYDGMEMINPFF